MNPLVKHKSLFNLELQQVDEKISSISSGRVELIGSLISHITNSGGKRLRPILVILSSKLSGNKTNCHIGMAACVELLHTATLFHDDVVDESKLRRGQKTANEVWGNSASILVGDFLLAQSFMLMAETGSMEIIDLLSDTSSIITEGEIKQLMHKFDINTSIEDYIEIINGKTAELFSACCKIGGVISNSSEEEKNNLADFGKYLGIAFQIADDVLDYSETDEIGKNAGDDFREGKVTLPIIHAYKNCSPKDREFLNAIFEDEIIRGEEDFIKIKKIIDDNKSIEYTLKKSEEYTRKAENALNNFDDSEFKEALLDILGFCISRKN